MQGEKGAKTKAKSLRHLATGSALKAVNVNANESEMLAALAGYSPWAPK